VTRERLAAAVLALAAAGTLAVAASAERALRDAWIRAGTERAEAAAAFLRRARAAGDDLLAAERVAEEARRAETAYVLVLDASGTARLAGQPSDLGRVFDSAYARAALAAERPIVQDVDALEAFEADVPLGGGAVLRLGISWRPLGPAIARLRAAAGLGAGALLLAAAGCWRRRASAGAPALPPLRPA
jgi:hypothetical protein